MIAGEVARIRDQRVYRELLHAMERARSRLAVAIAAENKATPREKWHDYLVTADQMCRCVREIRRKYTPGVSSHTGWFRALDLLRQPLPVKEGEPYGEAGPLCRRLQDVMDVLSAES